jgi:RimJ/RimL family protein N-acetyltransferase
MDEFYKKMSWEEYLAYPRKLGWKYEYFGEALHLSPSWTAIATFCLSLESPRNLRERSAALRRVNFSIRQVEPVDFQPLVSLFCECFSGVIDYAGCDSSDLIRYAHQSLDRFFGPAPAEYFGACRVAVEEKQIVGCCMFDRGKLGPVLQPVFVAPGQQRRGVATALLFDGLLSLTEQSEQRIHSRCNLGNEASLAWHKQSGFTEVPCRWAAGHRANIYLQEAERQELLRLPTATAVRELAEFWADQRARLEEDWPNDEI